MQDNKNNKKSQKPTPANQPGLSHVPANITHVLATNSKTDPKTKITIPSDLAVEEARNAVGENKK